MDSSNADRNNVFLGDAINIATRPVHTRLNKLILLRLPLAIPPRADAPSAYTQGILHIAPLYISFESLWHSALHAHESEQQHDSTPSQPGEPTPHSTSPRPFPFRSQSSNSERPSHGPVPSPRIHTILNQLFIPGLLRSSRLRSDLRALTGWSDAALQSRLEEVATNGRLGEIVAHIRRSAGKHPHVLLAYAWVLYMALFSGGRFVRATLESAGAHGFWTAEESASKQQRRTAPAHGPLDFFHFPTPQDGEDLKHEFKQRLADAGHLLTPSEREDIVKEAICIFENLILVINQLDDVCHTKLGDLNSADGTSVLSPRSMPGFRIRDSVIVTRERGYGGAKRSQPEEEPVPDSEEGSSSSSSTPSPEPQTEENEADVPKPERQKSCHTVQLASASPRIEKDDPFSSRPLSGRDSSNNNMMDADLAERLARAMRFDPQLPVPERTPSATGSTAEREEAQDDDVVGGGADKTDGVSGEEGGAPPRKRSDSTMARGIQVASALGVAVALAVAYSRG
ncbi:heme oxygenase-like protein [Coniochaeta ligniaria NRRL 30616]|uniref:Heme oxygenase-like protein n=1 Tax=Coniochaeta ligniaria NRRL 30616 TaxID=1408157 RepID=A0A1J7IQC1_9PEZI|nr:heme oxygenase-like protein [Coniochaeta ligniaria NRRL 30616]